MKRQTILLVGAAVVLVVGVVVWWRSPRPAVGLTGRSNNSVTSVGHSPSPTAFLARDDEKHRQQQERDKAVAEAIETTNVPITFWGKVVDQDQQPMGGVGVHYNFSTEHANALGVAWGQQKVHKGEVTTDVAGLFAVSGIRGHTLTIESLVKQGYHHISRRAQVYDYYGNSSTGRFTPQPSNPVVFVMMSKTAAEHLVSYGGNFGKTIRLPGDGQPMRWSLWKGAYDPGGELQISFKRDPVILERIGAPISWSAQIRIVGGGIVQALPDEPFYRAPEEGYVSELDYPKVEQKRGVPARSFYIKTAEGKYGRIELHLYADDEGATARCLIKVTLNSSGSRVLEPITPSKPSL